MLHQRLHARVRADELLRREHGKKKTQARCSNSRVLGTRGQVGARTVRLSSTTFWTKSGCPGRVSAVCPNTNSPAPSPSTVVVLRTSARGGLVATGHGAQLTMSAYCPTDPNATPSPPRQVMFCAKMLVEFCGPRVPKWTERAPKRGGGGQWFRKRGPARVAGPGGAGPTLTPLIAKQSSPDVI